MSTPELPDDSEFEKLPPGDEARHPTLNEIVADAAVRDVFSKLPPRKEETPEEAAAGLKKVYDLVESFKTMTDEEIEAHGEEAVRRIIEGQ